jgi:hypothetical protein
VVNTNKEEWLMSVSNQYQESLPREETDLVNPTTDDPQAEPIIEALPVAPPEAGWPVLAEEAFYGLPGQFTKDVEPYSEADPVGLLLHMLIAAGCLIGPNPYVLVEHSKHYPRLFGVMVGRTGSGRKGTALGNVRHVLSNIDLPWVQNKIRSGLSSGEGLIVAADEGDKQKGTLIVESEFASPLKVMQREGNTLSPIIRDAWDHGDLSFLTKHNRVSTTGAHISIIAHSTVDELLRLLSATEMANGFANRFLFALVRRSKLIPSGNGVPPLLMEPYFDRFKDTIVHARTLKEIRRDEDAEGVWADLYPKLEEERPGLTGAILARGAAQTLRLSLIYSLLDEKERGREVHAIRSTHLLAALAVWDYCKASVIHIFGDATGDPLADRLLETIKAGPQTDTDLYKLMGNRTRGKEAALDLLLRFKKVHCQITHTGGRPVCEWHYGPIETCVLCVKRV